VDFTAESKSSTCVASSSLKKIRKFNSFLFLCWLIFIFFFNNYFLMIDREKKRKENLSSSIYAYIQSLCMQTHKQTSLSWFIQERKNGENLFVCVVYFFLTNNLIYHFSEKKRVNFCSFVYNIRFLIIDRFPDTMCGRKIAFHLHTHSETPMQRPNVCHYLSRCFQSHF
jgi:hypothetical protein